MWVHTQQFTKNATSENMDLSPDVNFKQVSHDSVVGWLENKAKAMAMAKLLTKNAEIQTETSKFILM